MTAAAGVGSGTAELADLRVLRRLLLALIAPGDGPPAAALRRLSPDEWAALDHMAWRHRLQPLLHARRGLGIPHPAPVPQDVAAA